MSATEKILRGSASNVARLFLSVLVALALPPLLVRRLSATEYNAWVLILQLTSYVSMLDLGLQGIIGKVIAENHARADHESNHRLLNTSFLVLTGIAGVGMLLVAVMVWRVPQLFHQLPPNLLVQVRVGLAVMGIAAALSLPANPFLATFTGLQEYGFPTFVALISRAGSALILIVLVLLRASFIELACAVAIINIATAAAQFVGWRRFVRERVAFTFWRLHRATANYLLRTGGVVAVWTVGALFVNGLDLVIVGHFDYAHTGPYALAASVTNFMLMLVASILSPLLPAVAAMQTERTPKEIGNVTLRSTRYCTLLLVSISIPLLVFSRPLLTAWVGPIYARQIIPFLQWLLVSNCIRQIGYPYSMVVIATGKQNFATLATVSEAVVNFTVSIWLAHLWGAIGVAIGTFVGAFVSLALHLAVSMRLTRASIEITPAKFLLRGLMGPLSYSLPLLLLVLSWKTGFLFPHFQTITFAWMVAGFLALWAFGLTREERARIEGSVNALRLRFSRAA